MHYVRRVGSIDSTLAEREIIDSVEQVGLAHSIAADETVNSGGEFDIHLLQVPIIE